MKRIWILFLVAGIALVALSSFRFATPLHDSQELGYLAPPFQLRSLDGKSSSLGEFKEKPLLLHFWATWCGSCVKEFPAFARMAKDFAGEDIQILSISEDGRNAEAKVGAFVEGLGLTFPVLLDLDGRVADAYQSYGVPESFFIDRQGKVVQRINAPVDWDDEGARKLVKAFIAMPPIAPW